MPETTLLDWLDSLGVGAIAVSSDLRVHSANGQALETIERASSLEIQEGMLDSSDGLLLESLRSATSPTSTTENPSVRIGSQIGGIYDLGALALGRLRDALSASADTLTILTFAKSTQALSEGVLRKQFGLTPKQAGVALALYQGSTIREIAEDSGRSRETVRSHLRRIFEKLGVRRQSELVSLLSQSDIDASTL